MPCEKCKNGDAPGYVRDPISHLLVTCECVNRKARRDAFSSIGLPIEEAFLTAALDDFTVKQSATSEDLLPDEERRKIGAKALIFRFIEALPSLLKGDPFEWEVKKTTVTRTISTRTLVLSGPASSGKTLLLAIIANACLALGHRPRAIEWPEVMGSCHDFEEKAAFREMREEISKSQLLMVDNISGVYEYDARREEIVVPPIIKAKLDELFVSRPRVLFPTIFATDLSPQSLLVQDRYGPVLAGMFRGAVIVMLPAGKEQPVVGDNVVGWE
jgi:DNA replication protein DnaC